MCLWAAFLFKEKSMDEKRLQELGLNEAQVKAVAGEFATLQAENEKLKESAKGYQASIKELDQFKGTNADLTKKLEELQAKQKTDAETFKREMTEFRRDQALRYAVKALKDAVPHDPDLVMSLLDKGKISVDDNGNIIGLDSQIKSLAESKPFLFVQNTPNTETANKISGVKPVVGGVIGNNPAAFEQKEMSIGQRLAQKGA
jgi:hypothetical protein